MILKWNYWYFKNALSSKICDDIILYAKTKQEKIGLTDNYDENKISKKDIKKIEKNRKSNIVWLNENWIYKEIHPFIEEANKRAEWNFHWNYSEACQFTKYSKGQFYDWHQDCFNEPYNNPSNLNVHNKIRKLSVTCSLNDSTEYKGGELQFAIPDKLKHKIIPCKEILPKGSIVVFPSFVTHRVTPVTKGTRYSLVIWNVGDKFK
jgi:PKHD-type hydroxylase